MGNVGMFVTADFLWWKAQENDLMIAFQQTADTLPLTVQGNVIELNPKWMPGFRVGAGWNPNYDGWDVSLNWTWYRNSTSRSFVAPTDPILIGLYSLWLQTEATNFANVDGKWRLLLNMADLEIGRDFFVSCALSLRPYMGAEGGWIDRNLTVSYTNPDPALLVADTFVPGTYSGKTNYWGVGPRVGLNGDWRFFNSGFKVFGNLATALLYGKVFKNNETVNQFTNDDGVPVGVITTSHVTHESNLWRVVPHLQMNAGLAWGSCLNCNKMFLGVRLGWEVNQYFNLPHFVAPNVVELLSGSVAQERDFSTVELGMQGLTLDVKFDF